MVQKYLIKNVNIIPVTRHTILEKHDILIEGETIIRIEENINDAESTVINAQGKYLIPGLTDMHVHAWNERDLKLFVANGVTTIRNMWGSPIQLAWKKLIRSGEFISPSIYTTSPLVDGSPPIWNGSYVVTNEIDAKTVLELVVKAGYDQLKVYNLLTEEAYEALVEESKKVGIKITGHIPNDVGLHRAIEDGHFCIEHLSHYFSNCIDKELLIDAPKDFKEFSEYVCRNYDEQIMKDLVSKSIQYNVWNCVTLIVNNRIARPSKTDEFLSEDAMKYVSKGKKASWNPSTDFRAKDSDEEKEMWMDKRFEILKRITEEMRIQKAKVLFGTDTPNPFVVPGYSVHQEFSLLSDCGYTNYELLELATRTSAEFMGSDEFGVVAVGKRADLVLLDHNPLDDIENLKNPFALFLRGTYYSRKDLQTLLHEIEMLYENNDTWFKGLDMNDLEQNFLSYTQLYNSEITAKYKVECNNNEMILYRSDSLSEFQSKWKITLSDGFPVEYQIIYYIGSLRSSTIITLENDVWNIKQTDVNGTIVTEMIDNKHKIGFLNILDFHLLYNEIESLNNSEMIEVNRKIVNISGDKLVSTATYRISKVEDHFEIAYSTESESYTIGLWFENNVLTKYESEGKFGKTITTLES
ncbi:MAG: amidohydrolase family protein [Candidatus Heimdallarchaeota archaeon]|nr:amidohydrolase family protein [Candidatus Heimdallarchaeota archaeon]